MNRRFAVIGHPTAHTMSPFIHKYLFAANGIKADYSVVDVAPENLEESIAKLKLLDGFNITIPHKQSLIKYLDSTDASVIQYGAVNCVACKSSKMTGYNTDADGFAKALEGKSISLDGRVLVLGCGGAARALAKFAADNGCAVTIAARSGSVFKAEALAKWLISGGAKAAAADIFDITGNFDLLVNATPCGMYPNVGVSPISSEVVSHCRAVFDAVYNPEETELIKYAKALGIPFVGGMAMLVRQAAKAQEHWYGAQFDESVIERLICESNREMHRVFCNEK